MDLNPKKHSRWATLLLAGMVSLSLSAPASAAEKVQPLSNPSWTSPSLFTDKMDNALAVRATEVHAVPAKKLAYVHTQQDIPNTTGKTENSWYLDTLQAYSTVTGKSQWSYVLHESDGPYTLATQMAYTSYGTVYMYADYSDGTHKLHSIHPSGKANWVKDLPDASSISLLKDGSLLVASKGKVNNQGIIRSTLSRYDNNGKLLNQQAIQGSVLKADGNRIIVAASKLTKNQNGWQAVPNPRIDVYGLALKRLYNYQFPSNVNVYGDGSDSMFVLKNGTVLIRTNIDQVGNKLFAFDPKGKLLWGRQISGGSITQSTGTGYVTYENGNVKLFTVASGKSASSINLEGDAADYTWVKPTSDGNLMINMDDRTYILYPSNLAVIHVFDTTKLGSPIDYIAHTIYSVNEDTLTKYPLK
ncbi:PQQ-binding-like beta-propeller repeat protein [Paenibacillus shenyangensis]|uniref:PQQ-binding-like beta-propeller repeat protein n=1 Tax=Paenibacillus sp. A9 TaxID=1284352 RepID=UPI00037C598C|nr:PQQ-binding-like beta-propeller repeat protein [Paenibacillus sp. A9]